MQQLTQEGRIAVSDIAKRYQLSVEAIEHMLVSVNNGAGSMAQFNCPELGGSGQWMRGGMTMVGDMFNHNLKSTVDGLCNELSGLLANTQVFQVASAASRNSNQWWPDGLGAPHSSGSQNNMRYAVFANRLAVESGGQVTVYDTLDHHINGVSQQQGNDSTMTFRSQLGMVSLGSLPVVSGAEPVEAAQAEAAAAAYSSVKEADSQPTAEGDNTLNPHAANSNNESSGYGDAKGSSSYRSDNSPSVGINTSQSRRTESASDVISLIEKLAQLHSAGILSDAEFNTKKQELLARI